MLKELEKLSVEELLLELRYREMQSDGARASVLTAKAATDIEPGRNDDLANIELSSIIDAVTVRLETIYEKDDRLDLYAVADSKIVEQSDSIVALFRAEDVVDNGDGFSKLRTRIAKDAYNLCPVEPFINQPVGALCTGFLVAPDIIATAGHCLNQSDVHTIRFVFGFRMTNKDTAQTTISSSEIYKGIKIIGHQLDSNAADWTLVQLDRPVANHKPLKIRREDKIKDGTSLYVIGHPIGLPIKYAGKANVLDNSSKTYFTAGLDTYHGNSGSPVFNTETGEVEGILVRGGEDFVRAGQCNVSFVCESGSCGGGETCTRITELAHLLRQ